jgi:predicted DNA binding CopG/RHH family protein
MNSKKYKKIPKFKNEDEERAFWVKEDSTDYVDWNKAIKNPAMPNLKPSTRAISLRLSLSMLDQLKTLSNKKDIPYQSYIKAILAEKIREEGA